MKLMLLIVIVDIVYRNLLLIHAEELSKLSHNILSGRYEKNTFFNVSKEICVERWRGLVEINGRDHFMKHNYSQYFPDKVHHGNKKKLLLVHIGKTGGGTEESRLRREKIPFQSVHVHALDKKMLDDFDIFLIGLRHPVDRVISAYYFSHPLLGEAYYVKDNSFYTFDGLVDFYKCSPTLEEYANNLFQQTHCGDVARGVGNLENVDHHVHIGICAYLGGVVEDLFQSNKTFFIINSESLDADMNYVSKKLNWGVDFSTLPSKHVLNSSIPKASAKTLMQISGFLMFSGEISLYNALQNRFGRLLLAA